MTIYLLKDYAGYAATSLADAMLLMAALANPGTSANAATIARVTGKFSALVQSDTGEPLTVSSIDDATGTISGWVTDSGVAVAVGLGDMDVLGGSTYAANLSLDITGSTRTGNLALNTNELIGVMLNRGCGNRAVSLSLQIRKTEDSVTETVGLFMVMVQPTVLASSPSALLATRYLTADEIAAIYLSKASALYMVPLMFFGNAIDEQIFGYFYAEKAALVIGMQIAAQTAPVGSAVTVDLVNASGTEQTKIGTLAAGAKQQRTLFATPLTVAEATEWRGKIKTVGSTTPGGYLVVNLICQPQ